MNPLTLNGKIQNAKVAIRRNFVLYGTASTDCKAVSFRTGKVRCFWQGSAPEAKSAKEGEELILSHERQGEEFIESPGPI